MKKMINMIMVIACSVFSLIASAFDQQISLKTPRGSLIKIDIYNPGQKSVLVMGQGQGCGPRFELYDPIGAEAGLNGFTVVRLYWAYCVADPQNGNPADDLSTEKEDFLTALNYVRNNLGYGDSKIFIGGKSLGTLVSSEIFLSQKSLQGLVMLTPICTDAQTDPNNHKNIFAESYPGLNSENRVVLIAQGNVDPICETQHFQEYLREQGNKFVPLVVKGDHGFGIKKSDGQYNTELVDKNLQVISKWIFSWLK